jgi:hypothetical protein
VRWDDLFDDLAQQMAALQRAELDAEVAERTRGEDARIHLLDRLRAHTGSEISVTVSTGSLVSGRLARAGPDFLLVAEARSEALVPLASVAMLDGLSAAADPRRPSVVASRLGLAAALRALSRDRSAVRLSTLHGHELTGSLARVGADYAEIALHPVDGSPGRSTARRTRIVPFAALALIRHAG